MRLPALSPQRHGHQTVHACALNTRNQDKEIRCKIAGFGRGNGSSYPSGGGGQRGRRGTREVSIGLTFGGCREFVFPFPRKKERLLVAAFPLWRFFKFLRRVFIWLSLPQKMVSFRKYEAWKYQEGGYFTSCSFGSNQNKIGRGCSTRVKSPDRKEL